MSLKLGEGDDDGILDWLNQNLDGKVGKPDRGDRGPGREEKDGECCILLLQQANTPSSNQVKISQRRSKWEKFNYRGLGIYDVKGSVQCFLW